MGSEDVAWVAGVRLELSAQRSDEVVDCARRALEVLETLKRVDNRENAFLVAALAEAYQAVGRWSDAEQSLLALIGLRWDFYEGLVPWITAHYR